ncbi:FecR family protein [Dyella jiangningensis]|uniref:FecR family protein n=1 Tax=Dyella sp. AtDHG13 TaxID=1938897 RepID=UPI0008867120|nr:FecR domain-containing protein [Dyella sp. AtDHG13]PXV59892.1 FecR family protein [Dyella sp. AtDHG13]SDJ18662.1 FecR family protein [Dyella jiangningensis]
MNDSTQFDAARQARRITEQAVSWYIEQQEPLTERQRVAFLNWLRASPRHVAEYFAVAQMHGDLKAAASLHTLAPDVLAEQAARSNPVVMFPGMENVMREPRVPRKGRARRVAIAFAGVAATVAMAWLGVGHWRAASGRIEQSYVGDAATVRTIDLPDGTLVQLDRGSAIDVHFDGRLRRIEVVRGNALFDVGKDPARPLLVNVGGHVLQDIGTVFDVRRDAGGDTLTVISGRVRVLNAPDASLKGFDIALLGGDAVADLTAGQQISLGTAGVGAKQAAQLAQVTAWLPAEIRFQHETIGNVARRFNAYSSKPLVIENARIAGERISGIFHADNPQAFAAYLATLPDVRVIDEHDRVRIVAASQAETSVAHL